MYNFNQQLDVVTFDDAIDFAADMDSKKWDLLVNTSDLCVDGSDNGLPVLRVKYKDDMVLEDQGFFSLFSYVSPKSDYEKQSRFSKISRQPAARYMYGEHEIFSSAINDLLARANKQVKLRCFNNSNGLTSVRSVVSPSYLPIDNFEVLSSLREHNRDINELELGVYSNISRDSMELHFLLQSIVENNGQYGIGAVLRDNELGGHAVILNPMIQRNICTNSLISVAIGTRRWVHSGNSFNFEDFGPKLKGSLEQSEALVRGLEATKDVRIPLRSRTVSELMTSFAKKEHLNENALDEFANGMEGRSCVYGFVNGITHAAKFVPVSKRIELQKVAGNIVTSGNPGSYITKNY